MAASFKSIVITQAIAVVFFVVMPVLVTFVAPFSTLELRRDGSAVDVMVTRYVLVFVPWRTELISDVTQLEADITPAVHHNRTASERRKGRPAYSASTAQLVVHGDGSEVFVQVAPDKAKDIAARFDQFKADRALRADRIEVYASWWLSYVLGGVVSALCALYLTGCVLAIVTWPFKRERAT